MILALHRVHIAEGPPSGEHFDPHAPPVGDAADEFDESHFAAEFYLSAAAGADIRPGELHNPDIAGQILHSI